MSSPGRRIGRSEGWGRVGGIGEGQVEKESREGAILLTCWLSAGRR